MTPRPEPQAIADLRREVAEDTEVKSSAAVLIRGIGARIQAAVDQALENGATAEELAPLTELNAELDRTSNDLATAVAEST